MQSFPTSLIVVAVAIQRADGKFLLQRRPLGKEHGGLWEFPGGKIEAGESAKSALVREIKEELGLIIQPEDLQAATFATSENAPGPAKPGIVILLYTCRFWQGDPALSMDRRSAGLRQVRLQTWQCRRWTFL